VTLRDANHSPTLVATARATEVTDTVWRFLERIAECERRVGTIYDRFAARASHLPPVAAFWREMAADERMHAVVVTAARELFAPTESPPSRDWARELGAIEELIRTVEDELGAGLPLADAFARADRLEGSELNTVSKLIIEHAAAGFSRLGPLTTAWPIDRHREKLARARDRLAACVRTGGARA
jgi:rubrerythrin